MLEVKLGDLAQSAEALKILSELKMDSKKAYRMSKLLAKADEELKHFEKVRMQKATEFGVLSEEKTHYVFEGENQEKFAAAFNDLVSTVISIDADKLKIDDIQGDIEPKHLMSLQWLIEE